MRLGRGGKSLGLRSSYRGAIGLGGPRLLLAKLVKTGCPCRLFAGEDHLGHLRV